VFDYPFDVHGRYPSEDAGRVNTLRRGGLEAATVVWLPHFLSPQKSSQLGRLLKIKYLLERDRLEDYASHLSGDDRVRVRHQLQAQRDNLSSQLAAALQQLYGISGADESTLGAQVGDEGHVLALLPGHTPRLAGGAGFEYNVLHLSDGLFTAMYPKHPNFDPTGSRKAVTAGELRVVLGWITRAMEDGQRRVVVDRSQLALVKRIVHPLDLGEVSDGPLNLSTEWRRRIEQYAAQQGVGGDYGVEDIRRWIGELGYTGLDKLVSNLIIASYALLSDRAWMYHGSPLPEPPELDRLGSGHALRAQELPDTGEFGTARERSATLFGVHVPDVLFARNVNRLAAQVRAKVADVELAVNGVRRLLDKHASLLGLPVAEPAARVVTARHAAELVARLAGTREATPLVRELATATYEVSDEVLGAAISSAPRVLIALEAVDWSLLESARGFTGHSVLGDRAERLVSEVARAASEDEFTVELAAVLGGVRGRAVALISEAGRLARVTDPTPPAATPRESGIPADAAGVSLT
ncbi:MAG: PglY protein, partial [Sciscionella sp.]